MIFDKKAETMPRKELEQVQIERLQTTLNRVYRNVAFYKKSFDSHGVNIESIKSREDLPNLPFTTRADLLAAYPYDMFAVPLRDIVRIHSTSGTAGKPLVVGYTKNDLKNWTACTARLLAASGITEHDVVQIAFHYDLFTGGFGFHQGAELIGASVIPASTTLAEKQITIMKDYKTTALLCTPGFALHIAQEMDAMKIHPEQLSLKTGIFGAEPWSNSMRRQIETRLHCTAHDSYGLTEIMGPGVAGECEERAGLHVNEDHFIVEVVDPATGKWVGEDGQGELVFTTITKEGFPLIRYRTGDIASLISEPCSCGRTFTRITRVTGRTDDLIFFDGQKIFPSEIEQILLDVEGTAPHYQIVLSRENGKDIMDVRVEAGESFEIDKLGKLEAMRDTLVERIQQELEISAQVHFVEPRTFERATKDKIRRVIDKRESV
ncbi:MAG: phenylacetate--CoA ligase [Spirochaetales bacterium]|nr:phenylacetate--CoA ligase [Spirochaetales bacterium]